MSNALGRFLRNRRTARQRHEGRRFSLRQVAQRTGVEPFYLSKIERGLEPRPCGENTRARTTATAGSWSVKPKRIGLLTRPAAS